MLHIVNKTASLDVCRRFAQPGHAVLLIEDGVLAATRADLLGDAAASLKVYALQPDLAARGVAGRLQPGITTVDYAGFVELVATHPNNQSWL
ncbi:sulfurtransferase complex subunit TusB [Rubrivivax albus]|uniref:Sulfurtransferase complex subunit TusB n=1 Tax=Rubrivivax albus TaxID=2499835 RepID=A0A3S2WVQ7_9BURK|nr:sulfurtransferase complex subunit TusB [Rubrivivax albus]RVT52393.1 sulfurtransferase complex subunit TusB [Rubrivivax albus]